MKKTLALMLVLFSLAALTACADGPLVATATPTPSPAPTPSPTPVVLYQEDVLMPTEGMAALLPAFQTTLDTMMQQDETLFFASFTEPDPGVIQDYRKALADAGYNVIEEDSDMLFAASKEGTDGLLKVQIWYDSGCGTLQLTDNRTK